MIRVMIYLCIINVLYCKRDLIFDMYFIYKVVSLNGNIKIIESYLEKIIDKILYVWKIFKGYVIFVKIDNE